jgi:hypothetical protein
MRTLLPLLVATQVVAQTPQPDFRALGWLSGRWIGSEGAERFEEHWSLEGQSLLGVGRTLKGDRTTFVELFILEADGADLVLRLRMFGPALDRALRGKDEPLRLKLTEADATHFQCEGLGPEAGTTLVYRLAGPDRLEARLSKVKDGRTFTQAYTFTRAR